MTVRSSSEGLPSRTNWTSKPNATFSPWRYRCVPGATVSPLCTECATARPPDSKPSPDRSVLASTNRSSAGVTACPAHGLARSRSIGQEGVEAETGQSSCSHRRRPVELVRPVRLDHGPRLEPGGQRVAHAGDQQAHRRPGDDGGVHEDEVGIAPVEQVPVERPIVCVHDRQGAARCVARCRGRAVDHREVQLGRGRGTGRIEDLASPGPHYDPGLSAFAAPTIASTSLRVHSPPKS